MISTAAEVALLALGVFAVLTALTALAEGFRARVPPGRTVPGVETFAARVRSWWTLAILLALALLLGRWGVTVLFALFSFVALREFATLTTKARADHLSLALGFFLVLPLQFLLVALDRPGLFTVLIPVHVFLFLPVLSALRGSPSRFLARVAETQWALMICVYCASHVPALLTLDIPAMGDRGVLLIAFLVIAAQGADVLDVVAGRRWGRTPIAPDLSPRTWEGVGAAVGGAALIGAALAWLTPFGPLGAMLMAAFAAATALAGTIVLAAIKRERGVRDWSHLIPGQGGLLDTSGGVLFAAPLFYHLAAWGWAAP